jgi:uncharacterized protein
VAFSHTIVWSVRRSSIFVKRSFQEEESRAFSSRHAYGTQESEQADNKKEERSLRLHHIIWKDQFIEKIADKHDVTTDEVEAVLFAHPHVRVAAKGRVKDEHLYVAYGQTRAGRYLVVFFICKRHTAALPISARDMTRSERRYYDGQKEAH